MRHGSAATYFECSRENNLMKAILEDTGAGRIAAIDVPDPELRAGGILVRTAFSAISAGTERAKLDQTEKSLLGKAMARPDLVRQVMELARDEGIKAAYQKVHSRLDTLSPLGYSCSGVVVAAAEGVQGFQPGDRVACGGGGYANHSALNFVPQNLAVKLPDSVGLDAAALTTIGAIAIQGLRQSEVKFGETVAVIGAGLLGVLTIQLAKAAGCRVVAIDLHPERAERAVQLGADLGLSSNDGRTKLAVQEFSQYGADVVILTAATPSTAPIELAAAIARDRGRIVVVGDVGLGVSRPNVYLKELSITLSRSYGPGRYDADYEEAGIDYPIGHVRWTEKRNMEAFVQFLAARSINVAPLIEKRYPVEQGDKAYTHLRDSGAYTVLIEYPAAPAQHVQTRNPSPQATRKAGTSAQLKVGCIGAGGFARNIIIPALRNTKGVLLESVATASGIGAQSACKSFGFSKAQTPVELLRDVQTDAVFVLSRHDSHAEYVMASLANQKPVFVEKPLAISTDQLEEVRCAYESEKDRGNSPFLMVGFNRRFAPMTEELRRFFAKRQEPMVVNVRVNAGYLAPDHWTQRKGGGGRIIGEFCHFVDWARAVVCSPIRTLTAHALPDGSRYNRDNVVVTMSFLDRSIASLLYLANGDKSVPKEYFEVFCEGGVGILDDFSMLELSRGGKKIRTKGRRDKGHRRELELTIEAMRAGHPSPIPFEQLVEVSSACIAIDKAIATGLPISLQGDVGVDEGER
jgi:predicted dehydrogenase/threonine dehydrogenase-like Zn-dependent dehydrogenase